MNSQGSDDYVTFFEADLTPGDVEFLGAFQQRLHNYGRGPEIFALTLCTATTVFNAYPFIGWALGTAIATIMITVIFVTFGGLWLIHNPKRPATKITIQAVVSAISSGLIVGIPIAFDFLRYPGLALMQVVVVLMASSFFHAHTPSATKAVIWIYSTIVITSLVISGMPGWPVYVMALLPLIHVTSTIGRIFFSHFATRFVRERDLSAAADTVKLLLRDYESQTPDWLWETNASGSLINHSERALEVTGRTVEELDNMTAADLCHRPTDQLLLAKAGIDLKPFRDLEIAVMVNGEEHWWKISGRPYFDEQGAFTGWRGVTSDFTEAKMAEARIAYMARYDSLTELPNRAMFAETLTRAVFRRKDSAVLAVLYLDLDNFKTINDTLGHSQGDEVLKTAAARIEACLGVNDIVSRQGGDEFAVLLPDVPSRDHADEVAAAIIAAMAEPLMIDGQRINIGVSVGIAFAPDHALNAEDLIKHADLALYHSKENGRGRSSHFSKDMHEIMLARRQTEIDLREAIGNDELELLYQPLVNVQSGKVVGYEALLRWNHPENGLIMPETFIPVAEETGLIVPLGEWVIRNALDEVKRWPEDLTVAINLSPTQLASPNLLPTILNALGSTGVAPDRVELEITESVLMHDSEANIAILHKLRAIGVKVALDDFGTGYSSLNYLRSFPFDKIKIDRTFINEIEVREDNVAIVRAVATLARSLGMVTTAEGVERVEQLDRIRADGCNEVQGFYFSRPMRAGEVPGRREREQQPEPKKKTSRPPAAGRRFKAA